MAHQHAKRESGVALGMVVWFLAGMSLLVSGIVYQARLDTRMAQLHKSRAIAVSAGDGAMLLMLADLVNFMEQKSPGDPALSGVYTVGDHEVKIQLVPTVGLVNMGKAPGDLLVSLLVSEGGLPRDQAQMLADNVVKWRRGDASRTKGKRPDKLESAEDLMQINDFSRTVWDAIRDSIVVGSAGAPSGMDLEKAPGSLRRALAGGGLRASPDQAEKKTVSGRRGRRSTGGSYRVDALVEYGGRLWLRRKWVTVTRDKSGNSLPWQFNRVEAHTADRSGET
jgi:hypothetical protein